MMILVLLSQLIATSSRNVFGIGAYFPPGIEQIDDAAPLVGKSRITHWHSTTIVDSTNGILVLFSGEETCSTAMDVAMT